MQTGVTWQQLTQLEPTVRKTLVVLGDVGARAGEHLGYEPTAVFYEDLEGPDLLFEGSRNKLGRLIWRS
jgi:hypothetical protein